MFSVNGEFIACEQSSTLPACYEPLIALTFLKMLTCKWEQTPSSISVFRDITQKAYCYYTHQLFMVFKSHLLCSLADYCFIMLSTENAKYLGKNQAVALLNALKSSWESSLHTLMNSPGNMSSSGLSSLLASDNLLPSFFIVFVFWFLKKNLDKHHPTLFSLQVVSGRLANPDSKGSCLKCGLPVSFSILNVLIRIAKSIIIFTEFIEHISWHKEAYVKQNSCRYPSVCTTVFVTKWI